MGALAIPVEYDEKAVLLADDEPEYLDWLIDFLESLGLKVTVVLNVEQAMAACERAWYRVYIIDLNIPLGRWPQPTNAIFRHYCGFSIIQAIRSQGNDGRRVIAYSAHTNSEINGEMKRLYTDFIQKDHAILLKDQLREVLTQPDQTAAALRRVKARVARRRAAAALARKQRRKPKTRTGTAKKIAGSTRAAAKVATAASTKTREPQTTRTPSKSLTGVPRKAAKQRLASTSNEQEQKRSPSAKPKVRKPQVRKGPGKKVTGEKGTTTKPSPSSPTHRKKSET